MEPTPSAAAASQLADHLSDLVGERVRLVVHDNRSTMVSFRRLDRFLHYRVHHMFLDAPREVVHALASFAGSGRGMAARRREAGERIDAYVREHRARIADPQPARLDPRGRVHDLQDIFDRLNAAHFGGLIDARIGWGPNRGGRRRRTIKTGVYVQDARLIRIHPALDRPQVPEHYVAGVVFHEMLHQVDPDPGAERAAGGARPRVPAPGARVPRVRARQALGGREPRASCSGRGAAQLR